MHVDSCKWEDACMHAWMRVKVKELGTITHDWNRCHYWEQEQMNKLFWAKGGGEDFIVH